MPAVAFLIHPLGERDAGHGSARGDNLSNAMLWFRIVKEATQWAICYPTMAYLAAVEEFLYAPSMLVDHMQIARRCDVVVATGPMWSPHMRYVTEHATKAGVKLLDLVDLGAAPRQDRRDETKLEIIRRANELGL